MIVWVGRLKGTVDFKRHFPNDNKLALAELHWILQVFSVRQEDGGETFDLVKVERSREDPRTTEGLVSNLPHLWVNKTKQHKVESP